MDRLPEECMVRILCRGSPCDACRSSVVASVFRDATDSEVLWDKFLPSDHQQLISKSVSPVVYKSKKELFFKLSSPLLIDGGLKTFSIDKKTGKKCYMLSARQLYIAWSANPLFWCWKPLAESRFAEAVELRMTSWLEVEGKISTKILSPCTNYRAYLVFKVAHHRAYGLDVVPTEVSVEIGEFCARGTIVLPQAEHTKRSFEHVCGGNNAKEDLKSSFDEEDSGFCCERKDGWLEIKLGEFYNEGMQDKEIKMSLREANGVHLKAGLVVEGIEIRPV